MKSYEWTISTETIWTNFDFGEVQADSLTEAWQKAADEFTEELKKVNELLAPNYKIEVDIEKLTVREKR